VAAPTDEEKAYQYLWRFWRQIPLAVYLTLYDRSRYVRVLVERVEKFAGNMSGSVPMARSITSRSSCMSTVSWC